MTASSAIEKWRSAYGERRWADAVAYWDALESPPAGATDAERAATAMWLVGRQHDSIDLLTSAHTSHLEAGDDAGAVRTAVWLAIGLADLGEQARAGGWAARARSTAERLPEEDPARALAMLPFALVALFRGDVDDAEAGFGSALRIARGAGAETGDVGALACLGTGQARIMGGRYAEGVLLLDEAMVAVTAGEVTPIASGIIYCAVIDFCRLAWDVRRATEWTAALDRWCRSQSTMLAYSGQCEANRADLMRLHGRWDDALACAEEAVRRAAQGDRDAGFSAPYQRAEILRLRGDFDAADDAYRAAGATGWPPEPGHSLLRLAQGRIDEARTQLDRALEVVDPATRRVLLPASVEIALAAGDSAAGRVAADELLELAARVEAPLLQAAGALADGRVLRAEGRADAAAPRLQAAVAAWAALDAPYHAARSRAELAHALDDLGDHRAAAEERRHACEIFERLGAVPAMEWCTGTERMPGDLSPREHEVLRLLATGATNRQIAHELTLSEKTIARHLENVYAKLGVPSRAAATAWAFEHHVV